MKWLRQAWEWFTHLALGYRILVAIGAVAVLGGATAGALFLAFPLQTMVYGGMARGFLLTLGAPSGTLTEQSNPAYTPPGYGTLARSAVASAATGDWPSYNRTLNSDRFTPLNEINSKNVAKLKVLCTYDTGQHIGFETGPIMVNGALIATTEFDIFSINPATCAENWRTHEDLPFGFVPVNRGAAYLDGMLFRGTEDGRVFAYDFNTGKRIWETTIADPKRGESVPAAPIAWNGMVFIGNAGGDYKGGKGHMFALDAKTGKVLWEFYLVPQDAGDKPRGPVGASPLSTSTWKNQPGIPISGGGTWTSYTLDTKTEQLYVPGGNPAPDFASSVRKGDNLYTDSVIVLDPKTGNYKYHYKIVPEDWHDWDVSNPPILIQTAGGKNLMVDAPKDGYLYGFNRSNNRQVFKTPVTQITNTAEAFSHKEGVKFCPGAIGGEEWNSPVYSPQTNLVYTGEVDWCETVRPQDPNQLKSDPIGQPWAGMATWNPVWMFGRFTHAIGEWAGWLYATDADTGVWKWRLKTNYPIVGGVTATTGGVVFFGDIGGNLYAVDAATGQKLWGQNLGCAIGGGVITYTTNGKQRVAVAACFMHPVWPTKVATAKMVVLGLENDSSAGR
ncbi:MAG TPA: PQQ-binding-like beta-propeller repeat protein [Rhizomicrobium sp.]|nr:PQQ-binding-like beta-propeller repeat protein [Rhizomicrobium sp.]